MDPMMVDPEAVALGRAFVVIAILISFGWFLGGLLIFLGRK